MNFIVKYLEISWSEHKNNAFGELNMFPSKS